MRLTVLGCAGTFPGPDSPCSSYLVEYGGFRLLMDVGNGSIGALQRHADLVDVDAVFVSHLHGDHFLDLVPYAYVRRHHPRAPLPRLPVHGPAGTGSRLAAAGGSSDDMPRNVYDISPLTPGCREIGPFRATLVRMPHPVECYGIRLTVGGRTLAYSADTGPGQPLLELARDADVLLCEAAFGSRNGSPDLHLTGRQAGEHAAAAGAGRLLLTHLVAWDDEERTCAEAAAAYDGRLDSVASGDRYDI